MGTLLETDRLVLRTWTTEDAEAAFAMYGDPEVTAYLGFGAPDLQTQRERLRMLEEGQPEQPAGLGVWAIEEMATGDVVGCALLKALCDGPEIEVGWHLVRRAWGRGFATEAGRALMHHGFATVGLDRILALVDPRNARSLAVIDRLAFDAVADRVLDDEVLLCFEARADAWPKDVGRADRDPSPRTPGARAS